MFWNNKSYIYVSLIHFHTNFTQWQILISFQSYLVCQTLAWKIASILRSIDFMYLCNQCISVHETVVFMSSIFSNKSFALKCKSESRSVSCIFKRFAAHVLLIVVNILTARCFSFDEVTYYTRALYIHHSVKPRARIWKYKFLEFHLLIYKNIRDV